MGELVHSFSSLLFASPSFCEGAGRVMDFGDTLTDFNRCQTGDEADHVALASDWAAVGADLRAAFAAGQGAHGQGSAE